MKTSQGLVVAGGDDAHAAVFDRDLRRAQDMACGMERDAHSVDGDSLAIGDGLCSAREITSIAQRHDVERLACGEHVAVPGTRMVGVAVRDQRTVDRAHRVDEEIAGRAIEAFGARMEQGVGVHGRWKIGFCKPLGRALQKHS